MNNYPGQGWIVRDLESPDQPIVGVFIRREEDAVFYEDAEGREHMAPDDCVRVEPMSVEPPERFRVDVQGVGETIWVSNALRFDTEAEAERYARDLYARWTGMANWRIVPESTPERERIVPEATAGS